MRWRRVIVAGKNEFLFFGSLCNNELRRPHGQTGGVGRVRPYRPATHPLPPGPKSRCGMKEASARILEQIRSHVLMHLNEIIEQVFSSGCPTAEFGEASEALEAL